MIRVTRLGGRPFYLNSDLIESLESTPDTTLLLTTGKRVIVQEGAEEVIRRIVAFRRLVSGHPPGDDDRSSEVRRAAHPDELRGTDAGDRLGKNG